MKRRKATMAAAMFATALLAGCSGGGDGTASESDMLEACEEDRLFFTTSIDVAPEPRRSNWVNDPNSHWESSLKPITEADNFYEYDTGVVDITGQTDGIPWGCLYNPKTEGASWGWSDPE